MLEQISIFAMTLKRITRAIKGLRYRRSYVVLDGRVSSVTLSKGLYNLMMSKERADMYLHVFQAKDSQQYCFAFREDFEQLRTAKTVFTELQYNSEYKKIGFHTELPTVSGILSEYDLPIDKKVRLTVIPRKTGNGETFYEIQRPLRS